MESEVAQDGPELVVRLAGDLDVLSAEQLTATLEDAEKRSRFLVLDLQAVSFIDSTALGALVGSTRRLRDRGGDLKLLVSSPHILRVLRVTNLDSLIMVVDKSTAVAGQ